VRPSSRCWLPRRRRHARRRRPSCWDWGAPLPPAPVSSLSLVAMLLNMHPKPHPYSYLGPCWAAAFCARSSFWSFPKAPDRPDVSTIHRGTSVWGARCGSPVSRPALSSTTTPTYPTTSCWSSLGLALSLTISQGVFCALPCNAGSGKLRRLSSATIGRTVSSPRDKRPEIRGVGQVGDRPTLAACSSNYTTWMYTT
jgi:hypothetical protein